MIDRDVFYKDIRFSLQSNGKYYLATSNIKPERLLHRRIWFDNFGEIPKGFHVHHINGDWTDNRIENLECIEGKIHAKNHMKERMSNSEYRRKTLENLTKAQDSAKEWHASRLGREWHSKISKQSWGNKKKTLKECIICRRLFETYFANRKSVRFCSSACEAKDCYKRYFNDKRKCGWCGIDFLAHKYRKTVCCSYTCSARKRVYDKKL